MTIEVKTVNGTFTYEPHSYTDDELLVIYNKLLVSLEIQHDFEGRAGICYSMNKVLNSIYGYGNYINAYAQCNTVPLLAYREISETIEHLVCKTYWFPTDTIGNNKRINLVKRAIRIVEKRLKKSNENNN